jgi:hypothetical protein
MRQMLQLQENNWSMMRERTTSARHLLPETKE